MLTIGQVLPNIEFGYFNRRNRDLFDFHYVPFVFVFDLQVRILSEVMPSVKDMIMQLSRWARPRCQTVAIWIASRSHDYYY